MPHACFVALLPAPGRRSVRNAFGKRVFFAVRGGPDSALALNHVRAHNANPISIMALDSDDQPLLGEIEQLVLLAVLRLADDAYAVPIRDLIAEEGGIELSRGTIYVTLERLERKGYVTSWFSDPQAVRGGKARRVFRMKPAGLQAVRAAKRAVDRLAAGTVLSRPIKGVS